MTTKERARLHGFWTHKQTGEHIVVNRVTMQSEVYARQVDKDRKPINKVRFILLARELKEEYVKGMR